MFKLNCVAMVTVELYKCSYYSNCGTCSTDNPNYNCAWCDDNRCDNADNVNGCVANLYKDTCPNPEITEVSGFDNIKMFVMVIFVLVHYLLTVDTCLVIV